MAAVQIPVSVAEDIRKMLGLSLTDAIPQEVEDAYCSYRYMKDLLNAGDISVSEIILIAMIAQKQGAPKKNAKSR